MAASGKKKKKFMTLPNSPNEHFLVLASEGIRPRPLGEEASDSKRQSMSEFSFTVSRDDQSDEAPG